MWQWVIGTAITLGLASAGGIWALVKVVANVATEAATIKTQLALVIPVAQEMPAAKQSIAVLTVRVDDHEGEINGLRDKTHDLSNTVAEMGGRVRKH